MLLWLFAREAFCCKETLAKEIFRHKCQDVCISLSNHSATEDNVWSIYRKKCGKILSSNST